MTQKGYNRLAMLAITGAVILAVTRLVVDAGGDPAISMGLVALAGTIAGRGSNSD